MSKPPEENNANSELLVGQVGNAPVKSLHHRDFSIEGYSRAAVQTYWRIPEYKVGFDVGAQPWEFMGTPTWFISHTHLDHIAALPVLIARRRMMKMSPPTIYVHDSAIEAVDQMLNTVSRLDRGRLPCELRGMLPGDEIEISRDLVVTVTDSKHTIPALGFIVWERRRKLKPELSNLTGDQIRDLRLAGREVTDERRIPRVAYVGDSAPAGLDNAPEMYRAQVLITEMTFVAPQHRVDKIHKRGHMHLDDYVQRRERFQNERIIVGHFSTRYNHKQVQTLVKRAFPDMLDGRLVLWL